MINIYTECPVIINQSDGIDGFPSGFVYSSAIWNNARTELTIDAPVFSGFDWTGWTIKS